MTITSARQRYFWERSDPSSTSPTSTGEDQGGLRVPDGADLAALRRGLGREPGSVPGMWPFYTTLSRDGVLTDRLRAEHVALCLFALHQQGQTVAVHRPGVGLGRAMAALRTSGRFAEAAIDRRFTQAATSLDVDEVGYHLRSLVTLLRTLKPAQPVDYTRMYDDLRAWQDPARRGRVRRRWGSDYYLRPDSGKPQTASNQGMEKT